VLKDEHVSSADIKWIEAQIEKALERACSSGEGDGHKGENKASAPSVRVLLLLFFESEYPPHQLV
jgi:hypothetical protein